jgi:hypothetical protein
MKLPFTKFEIILTLVILCGVTILVQCRIRNEEKRMAVEHYVGTEGVTVNVESADDVYEALDEMHTQVMENLGEDHPLTKTLADFMDTIADEYDLEDN